MRYFLSFDRRPLGVAVLWVAWWLVACGDDPANSDPDAAKQLLARVQGDNYHAWARAPGYERRQPGTGPHGGQVDIFINEDVEGVIGADPLPTAWPVGSLIVKDGYGRGGMQVLTAIMEKRDEGWFWAEFDGRGRVEFSGDPPVCTGCHAEGDDFVRAFGFEGAL